MGGFTSREDQCSPVTGFSDVADWCIAHTDNTWVRLHDCDRPVAFGGQVNCMLRHHQGTLTRLVRLWKVELFLCSLASGFVSFLEKASVWYCRLQSDRPRLFIFRFFELHTTPQSSLYFILFLLISVKWCLFIKAIELLQCLNDPDLTHIHLANCTDSDKCTDNQRERHPSSGWSPSTWRAGPGPAETEPFRNVTVGHVYMHPCVCSQRKTLLCEEAFDESCQNAHPTSTS